MSKKDFSSYDLWNAWRDFNQTGKDQSEGATSVLNEDASGPGSQTLATESEQLAPAQRRRMRVDMKLPVKDVSVQGVEDILNVPHGRTDSSLPLTDIPDTEQELVQLMNYLLSMGVPKSEAQRMVDNVMDMIPVKEGVTIDHIMEACGCGGMDKSADSIPNMGRMLDYGDENDSDEGEHARDQLQVINYLSGMLVNALHDEDDLPTWVQTYVTQAELLMQKTFKYLVPHMQRVETGEAQQASQGGDGNVLVVAQESKTPTHKAKSRADARVRDIVRASRKSGKMEAIKLSDIFED